MYNFKKFNVIINKHINEKIVIIIKTSVNFKKEQITVLINRFNILLKSIKFIKLLLKLFKHFLTLLILLLKKVI